MNDSTQTEADKGPISGLLHSLTQVVATLVTMAQTRLELLTTELQDEVGRAAALLIWAFVALLAAGIGLFLAALVLIFVFWDTHRVLVSILVTSMFFAIAVFAGWRLRTQLRTRPRLLDATLTELALDKERLEQRLRQSR